MGPQSTEITSLGDLSMDALLRDLAGFFCTVMTPTANIPLAFKTIITCHYLLQEQEGKSWLGFVFFYT